MTQIYTSAELHLLRKRLLAATRYTEQELRERGSIYDLDPDDQMILEELDEVDFLLGNMKEKK